MNTAFWLTIQLERKRISLPLPIILPLVFVIEILVILPITVYAIVKVVRLVFINTFSNRSCNEHKANETEKLLLRLAYGFYLSRLTLVFILHGRGFKIVVCENDKKIQIVGCWKC